MAEILYEKNGKRTIQLDISFSSYDSEVTLTIAHLYQSCVDLVRLQEIQNTDEEGRVLPNEKFHLTFEEMNALGQAWSKYQFDLMIAKEEAELKLRNELAEAKTLAAQHGITVEVNPHYEDNRYYIVKHPNYYNDEYVIPEEVLSTVKRVAEYYIREASSEKPAVDPTPEPNPLAYDV